MNDIADSTAKVTKLYRARIGGAVAEGSESRKGAKTQASVNLIVGAIVAFKCLPDVCCDQVPSRMAEARCLIFSLWPMPLGICRNATNGATTGPALGAAARSFPRMA
jgi:hypothetical protein